jgi:hypothetical protein
MTIYRIARLPSRSTLVFRILAVTRTPVKGTLIVRIVVKRILVTGIVVTRTLVARTSVKRTLVARMVAARIPVTRILVVETMATRVESATRNQTSRWLSIQARATQSGQRSGSTTTRQSRGSARLMPAGTGGSSGRRAISPMPNWGSESAHAE